MVWQKAVRPRWLLSDLLKIPTNQLCRIQSKLPPARNIALLSCSSFCELKAISISVISFAHTALCGGEFQALTFWEPLLASSFFFSVINSLNNVLSLIFGYIHVYVCVHTCVKQVGREGVKAILLLRLGGQKLAAVETEKLKSWGQHISIFFFFFLFTFVVGY